MKTENSYFWFGEWMDKTKFEEKVRGFTVEAHRPLQIEWLLESCEKLSQEISRKQDTYQSLVNALTADFPQYSKAEKEGTLIELSEFLKKDALQQKISRELCSSKPQAMPFLFERIDYKMDIYEKWAPLGFLVHIAPSNAINIPFLTLIEGLMTGNINFLKLAENSQNYTLACIREFLNFDSSHEIQKFISAAYIPVKDNFLIKTMNKQADGVIVWGTEETVQIFKEMVPLNCQLISWGPKISFAYFDSENFKNVESIKQLATEIFQYDQQSCSSPQVVYLETDQNDQLHFFSKLLAEQMTQLESSFDSPKVPKSSSAEITQIGLMQEAEQAWLGQKQSNQIKGSSWRILIDERSGLQASPLYRSIWVKPIKRGDIVKFLKPLRMYLQTVGLKCELSNTYEISNLLFQAGVSRITSVGKMVSGYMGEPHDGVYALQRYSRRISASLSLGSESGNFSCLEEIAPEHLGSALFSKYQQARITGNKIMTAADVSKAQKSLKAEDVQVYFKTGGSSGEPKLSIFTYDDYELQMKFAAQGLFAAGLDPKKDRCINLFFAGGLYGGFLSFFSILENLKAVQLPMAAESDYESVGKWIVAQKINVLLGMPTYLSLLFEKNRDLLLQYGGIKKIFYGGEHFSESQRKNLISLFGVETIRSATYGSNETGPMAFQCQHSAGSVHHLHEQLQFLEIQSLQMDQPVENGEVGRIILTSKVRSGQSLVRYEIGDLARWVPGRCKCGRTSARFELMGRYGDVFKVGTIFLSYKKFETLLSELEGFTGVFQLIVESNDQLVLRFVNTNKLSLNLVLQKCLSGYSDLNLVVTADKVLNFKVEESRADEMVFAKGSGKLKSVVDRRGDLHENL